MPLHRVDFRRDAALQDIYATGASESRLPKYRMPDRPSEPHTAYNMVRDELLLDGNSRQNLATFCTTWVEDEVKQLMTDAVDKNMIDKDEYPQTAEIENRCVHIIADLWHAPKSWETIGCSTTGSSGRCTSSAGSGPASRWRRRARSSTRWPAERARPAAWRRR